MPKYFKIGELSQLYGIGVDSLRYYEKIGLLRPERAESGYRHYSLQDIWKLNIIRDLRALGFGMEQIRTYLETHTVDTTLALLQQEKTAIDEKICYLEGLRRNVCQRMETISEARVRPMDTITLTDCPERHCYCIPQGYQQENEMDVLIQKLLNLDKQHLYVIGSNQIGTAIDLQEAEKNGRVRYISVFLVDKKGEKQLPRGTYLTVSYRGGYEKSKFWVKALLAYAAEHGLRLKGDLLEILWIDIHTSAQEQEHVTELQVLTEPK